MLLLFSITQRPIEKAVIFLGRRGVGGGGGGKYFFYCFWSNVYIQEFKIFQQWTKSELQQGNKLHDMTTSSSHDWSNKISPAIKNWQPFYSISSHTFIAGNLLPDMTVKTQICHSDYKGNQSFIYVTNVAQEFTQICVFNTSHWLWDFNYI